MSTPSVTAAATASAQDPSRLRTRRTTTRARDLLHTDLIRRRRLELGLSREDVARASDLALSALTRIEDGRAGDGVTIGQLAKLAETLGLETRTVLRPASGDQPAEPAPAGIDRDWVADRWDVDVVGYRFHHRLVQVHPFPNGNGRHARAMTDLLVRALGRSPFTWGSASLIEVSTDRSTYIRALQAADDRRFDELAAFVRS